MKPELVNYSNKDGILRKLEKRTNKNNVTNCWLWLGACNDKNENSYGVIVLHKFGKKEYVHRLSAFIFLEYDIENTVLQVNHKIICPNKNCWNPEHIYVGTSQENIRDMILTGSISNQNKYKTECKYGHKFTEENTFYYKDERQCRTCRKERREYLR